MSNRIFYSILALLAFGFVAAAVIRHRPETSVKLTGIVTHPSQGENHITEGATHVAYNSDLPSSGPHYQDITAPAQWGVYVRELPPEVFLHNEEHGGVIVAYRPDLPKAEITKLQKLFAPPYADKNFSPGKAILMPRASNKAPIEMAGWTVTYNLNTYDQAKIEAFYDQNVSNKRAPEAFGGPRSAPINEAGV